MNLALRVASASRGEGVVVSSTPGEAAASLAGWRAGGVAGGEGMGWRRWWGWGLGVRCRGPAAAALTQAARGRRRNGLIAPGTAERGDRKSVV